MTPAAAVAHVWSASLPAIVGAATAGAGIDLVDISAFGCLVDTGGQAFLDNAWTYAEQRDSEGSRERLAAR